MIYILFNLLFCYKLKNCFKTKKYNDSNYKSSFQLIDNMIFIIKLF